MAVKQSEEQKKTAPGALNYTPSQKEAVTAAQKDVLVSAAAGSGKTRVLTERVVQLVRGTDAESFRSGRPVSDPAQMADISRMLMVTFTRAAASEMRSRIVAALGEAAAAEKDPQTARKLHAQAEAAAGADITTFHGFCRKIIAENYEAAGVSAGFGILGNAQGEHLRTACLRQVMDELYQEEQLAQAENSEAPAAVHRLLLRYGSNGSDEKLMELISSIYDQMMGQRDPHAWLELSLGDIEERLDLLYRMRRDMAHQKALMTQEFVRRLVRLEHEGFPQLKTTRTDSAFLEKLESSLAEGNSAAFPEKFPAIGSKEKETLTDLLDLREQAREAFSEASALLKERDRQQDLADLLHTRADVRALTDIVRKFEALYTRRKETLNKVDFSDLEHKALRVLNLRGAWYAEKYQYIFVDEYQDTNPVQDAILQALHLSPDGTPLNHQFLVGDMKQSIYRFRNADPRIFEGRSRLYAAGENPAQRRISMNENFRSSPAVIDGVNHVMGALMDESLGEISYAGEELICGRPDAEPGVFEVLLAPETEETSAACRRQAQADMIADKILQLKENGRRLEEIAVLFRSRSDLLFTLSAALEARGIPAAAQSGVTTVYIEIDIFLHLLRLVINDRQDVPLLSVLRSFLFGFDERDFVYISEWESRGDEENAPFFSKLLRFREKGAQGDAPKDSYHAGLHARVEDFYRRLERLRAKGTDMSVERFAEEAGERFNFPSYLLTRPNGESRRRMYDALLDIFAELGELHGNSLLRVLNAVDDLRTGNQLFKARTELVKAQGAVRLMTAHGSKGLEFPVVFLAALDQNFRLTGGSGPILTSSVYGIAAQYVDEETLTRRDTLETELIAKSNTAEELSEELRVLYVSMTRPREELYLCGAPTSREAAEKRWAIVKDEKHNAKSSLEWIMCTDPPVPQRREGMGLQLPAEPSPAFDWNMLTAQLREVENVPRLQESPRRDLRIEAQRSVSEMVESDFDGYGAGRGHTLFAPVLEGNEEISASRRGTMVHRLMHYAIVHQLTPQAALTAMKEKMLVTGEEAGALAQMLPAVGKFFASTLYTRLRSSSRVLCEQRFRLLMDADEVNPDAVALDGQVRVQGMIDLAFREEDGWVLIDYKTDTGAGAGRLAARYGEQLELYARALEEITGLQVKEKILFSFALGRGIPVS